MDLIFYIEISVYIIWAILMVLTAKNHKAGVLVWRVSTLVFIFYFILMLCFSAPKQRYLFIIILAFQNLINTPLLAHTLSTCSSCGKRVFWRPLVSNHCQYCNKIIYPLVK